MIIIATNISLTSFTDTSDESGMLFGCGGSRRGLLQVASTCHMRLAMFDLAFQISLLH